MKALHFSGLRSRLIFLVLLSIVPLIGLLIYTAVEHRQHSIAEAQRNALRLANEIADSHGQIIESARHLLIGLAQLPEVLDHNSRACDTRFATILQRLPHYTVLAAAKSNGDVFCSGLLLKQPVNISDRPYFQESMQERDLAVSGYQIGRISGKATVAVSYPSVDTSGSARAVVFLGVDIGWLDRVVAQMSLPTGTAVTLINQEGTILYRHPDSEKWVGKPAGDPLVKPDKLMATAGLVAEGPGMDGVPQIFAFSMVRGVPEGRAAIVRVGLPKAWVLVEVNRISKRNVALTVLVILLALILTRVFSEQSLLRPIESLVNATNRLAGGDLGVRTGLPYRAGELGQLAESFDAMADALQTEEAERMRAQQALRTSEARYRSVAQSAKNGIIIADSKGNIVAWNKGAQETFGYAEEEVLGKPLTLLMPTRYHEAHRRGLEQFRSTGESRVIGAVKEYEGLRRDGSEFPVELSLSSWQTEEGVFFSGIARDITERKQAEQMLRESELRYRTLFEMSPSGILLIDPETMLPIDFNPTAHHQLGYSREEFAKLHIPDYDAVETPEETKLHIEKILRDGRDDFETKHRTKQGEIRNVLVTVQKLHLSGRPIFHSIFRDITNLKREQEKIAILAEIDKAITSTLQPKAVLNLLLEKIGALLPYSAAAVMLLNKVTGEIEPAAAWNINEQRWKEHITRIQAGSFLGRRILETRTSLAIINLHTDPRPLEPAFFRREGLVSYVGIPLIAKDQPLGILSIYTKEGHEFSTEEVEFLSTLGGQAAIAIHNAELYDETRKLAIDLENAVRVKDDFLSVMSHELRTPLNVVMGYAAMMKDGMLGDLNPKQDDALGKILGRANDQLAMISNILFATAIDTAKIPVDHQGVILADLFNDLESAYHAQVTGPDLTLNWDCPPDLPILETDRAKLKQILQNLIDNAIKFTAKGQITISARHLAASPRLPLRDTGTRETGEAEKWVEFTVTDTGVGIPQDMVAAIFEKFRQVDSSETRPYGGVGMGLYIVKKFTEMLGGTVEVESEPGKGSTFTVRIPS